MAKRRKKKQSEMIDYTLLVIKTVPASLVASEKVTEKLTGKKIKPKLKKSTQYKAAIRNYKKAVTRYRLSVTLLKKHEKILAKMRDKYL